jgi:hypothetical protein
VFEARLTSLPLVVLSAVALDACSCTPKEKPAPEPSPILDTGSVLQAGSALDAGVTDQGGGASAELDAGAAQFVQIACSRTLESCNVRGIVRYIEPGTGLVPQLSTPERVRGLVVKVDTIAPPYCPFPAMNTGFEVRPDADTVFVALPPGISMRLRVGEAVCASVYAPQRRDYPVYGELLARPDGSILYAHSPVSPLPGWAFKLGPSRSHERQAEGYFRDDHAVLVTHAGRTALVGEGKPARMVEGDHGRRYDVWASGYTLSGKTPPWMIGLGREGFEYFIQEVADDP